MLAFQLLALAAMALAWQQASVTLRFLARRTGESFNPTAGLIAGSLYFILLPLTAIALVGEYSLPSHHNASDRWATFSLDTADGLLSILYPSITIILTSLFIRFSSHWRSSKKQTSRETEPASQTIRYLLIFSLIALAKWLLYILVLGWEGLFLAGWLERTEHVGGALGEVFWLILKFWQGNSLLLTSSLIMWLQGPIRTTTPKQAGIVALAGATILIEVFLSGNRIFVALMLITYFSHLLIKQKYLALLLVALSFPGLSILSGTWAYYRINSDVGLGASLAHISEIAISDPNMIPTSVIEMTEGANSLALMAITRDFGNEEELLLGHTLIKVFLLPVPRSIYPNKPENFNLIAAAIYEPNIPGFSLNTTIFGELFANLSYGAAPALIFITWLLLLYSRSMARSGFHPIKAIALFQAMLWMARTNLSDSILLFATVLVAFSIAQKIQTRSQRRIQKNHLIEAH